SMLVAVTLIARSVGSSARAPRAGSATISVTIQRSLPQRSTSAPPARDSNKERISPRPALPKEGRTPPRVGARGGATGERNGERERERRTREKENLVVQSLAPPSAPRSVETPASGRLSRVEPDPRARLDPVEKLLPARPA